MQSHAQTYVRRRVCVGNVTFGGDLPFALIAGPCQIESESHAFFMAEKLSALTEKLGVPFVFKSSFDKANRTSLTGKRGAGMAAAQRIFAGVKERFGCPVLTDVHEPAQCAELKGCVDILQIPAFLCRQTDLIVAAAKTGLAVNVKKGQFLAPHDMASVAQKCADSGNDRILLTERGVSFGYNTLVNDMRGLQIMAEDAGYPVIFDATHSVQQPGALGGASGGQRKFVPVLARAAIASGVAGIFAETHDDPDNAASDGPCMMRLDAMESFLRGLQLLDGAAKTLINA
ncbi:MAG: 3-deoxy-8-phosphooctulonate synthase [Rickettsiales bacterium]